jgi:hypothetical protein
MRLYLKICALVAVCISGGAHAQAAANWQDLKVGGGGYVRGLIMHSDGTMVGRTDTAGAYLWNGSAWVQLVTSTSLPAAVLAENPDSPGGDGGYAQGVYEVAIAPSNSSIMYMSFGGYVFKTTNKGTTWTQTALPYNEAGMNPNDSYAQIGQKMAVDPNNSNIVYLGTENNGLYVTTNGGTSWSLVSGVPAGTTAGITGILFYGGGGAVGGVTQVIYACRNGTGVYVTTNGGTTWTLTGGGPTTVQNAVMDTAGNYWAVGNGGAHIFKYNGSSWATVASPGGNAFQALAINPLNQRELVAIDYAGQPIWSNDGGSTWTGPIYTTSLSATDIPWLKAAVLAGGVGTNFFLDVGNAAFSPVTNGLLYLSGGSGVWSMNFPAGATGSTQFIWNDMSVGIENLVANAIVVPPTATSYPILASWDRPFFKITNPNTYPSTYGPVNSSAIVAGWSIDYASSNPGFVVGLADNGETGYSTDGGATWTSFATTPPAGVGRGGTIAASTPQNIIWAPANRTQPSYTMNQGASWTGISLPGVSSWSNFDYVYYLKQRSVTADRVLANTFYLYYGGNGVFKTTNGGATWTNVHSGYIESNGSQSGFNSTIMSVPGNAGHLFYTGGPQTPGPYPVNEPFYRSTDGGVTWTPIANVLQVSCFGFGAAASGQSYPAIYIVGFVNSVYGIWQSIDNAVTWTKIGDYPLGWVTGIGAISGDPNIYGQVYVGLGGGGYAYLPASGTTQQNPVPMPPTNLTVH